MTQTTISQEVQGIATVLAHCDRIPYDILKRITTSFGVPVERLKTILEQLHTMGYIQTEDNHIIWIEPPS